jgi:hypothetical protein
MRAGGRKNRNNCAEPGPMQALFDGTVLRLACVNRDWAGQAAGPAMSAMPRKRRLARKRRPVVMGQNEKSGPGNCHSYARVHRGCCTRQAVSKELVTTLAGVRDRFNFAQSRRLETSSRWDDGNVVEGSDAPTVLFLCQDQLQTRAVNTVASARMPGGNLV